jgi:hypothetical protein
MKKQQRFVWWYGVVLFGMLVLLRPGGVLAEVPGMISYQGQLTDSSGVPVPDDTYSMRFYIYNADSGTTLLWPGEEQDVAVTGGIYQVQLGGVSPLNAGVFENAMAWLEVHIYNETGRNWEMLTPRQRITAAAYALKAADADTLGGMAPAEVGDITGVTAGTGLEGGGSSGEVTVSASTSFLQRRVSGTCPSGSSIRAISETGAVTCETDDPGITAETDPTVPAYLKDGVSWGEVGGIPAGFADGIDNDSGGDIKGVLAGTGLDGGGTSGTVSLNVENPFSLTNAVYASGVISGTNTYSASGYGIVGEATGTSGRGVYGFAGNSGTGTNYGGYFSAAGSYGRGVYGTATGTTDTNAGGYFTASGATGRGVYAYASGADGYGIYAASSNGDGIYGATAASDEHAGYFSSSVSVGLPGAVLYARNANSSGQGIALWAQNVYSNSTDAVAVLSSAGNGPLLKGFGSNGGEDEVRIDNDGTMRFFNSYHEQTVVIAPEEGTGGVGGQITLYDGDGNATIQIDGDYNGDGRITTQELQITGGSDLSEQFDIRDGDVEIFPGMVVSIDPDQPGNLAVSRVAYDNRVAGIISGAGGIKSGMMMGQKGSVADGQYPVALTGRVYCQADASTGAIQPGDLLTTSDLAGHAMKVSDHSRANGAVLGKAMTSLDAGTGLVLVLVSLQ